MTEHNHRRGTKTRGSPSHGVPKGYCLFAQRFAHHQRRGLVRKLLSSQREDDIPGNTPKYIRWEYW